MALFIEAWIGERRVGAALDRSGYVGLADARVLVLSVAAALLSVATLVVIIAAA